MVLTPSSIVHALRVITPTVKLIMGHGAENERRKPRPGRPGCRSVLDLHFGQAQGPGTSFGVAGHQPRARRARQSRTGKDTSPRSFRGPNPADGQAQNITAVAPTGAVQGAGAQEDAVTPSIRVPVPTSR